VASASKEAPGASGQWSDGNDGAAHGPADSEQPGVETRTDTLGGVSSLMVHGATHGEEPFGQIRIAIPGRQLGPPKDPSEVSISFIPPIPRKWWKEQQ